MTVFEMIVLSKMINIGDVKQIALITCCFIYIMFGVYLGAQGL